MIFNSLWSPGTTFQKHLTEVFNKKRVLLNFPKFTRKHLCWNLFFCKKRPFLVNFTKLLRTPILRNICRRLLLTLDILLSCFSNPIINKIFWGSMKLYLQNLSIVQDMNSNYAIPYWFNFPSPSSLQSFWVFFLASCAIAITFA